MSSMTALPPSAIRTGLKPTAPVPKPYDALVLRIDPDGPPIQRVVDGNNSYVYAHRILPAARDLIVLGVHAVGDRGQIEVFETADESILQAAREGHPGFIPALGVLAKALEDFPRGLFFPGRACRVTPFRLLVEAVSLFEKG